jgi:hypothetical protein
MERNEGPYRVHWRSSGRPLAANRSIPWHPHRTRLDLPSTIPQRDSSLFYSCSSGS